jgi:hypothetical protein
MKSPKHKQVQFLSTALHFLKEPIKVSQTKFSTFGEFNQVFFGTETKNARNKEAAEENRPSGQFTLAILISDFGEGFYGAILISDFS